jgi:hypothetical protein
MELPSRGRARRSWLVAGLVLTFGVPLVATVIAALWSNGIIAPDPDGPLVTTVQSLLAPALLLAPVGLIVAGWALRLRGIWAWLALFLYGAPAFLVLWFVGAAGLGGLAGEPF